MSKKTIIIFISVFIAVGILLFGLLSLLNKNKSGTTTSPTPWYQNFNPFSNPGKTTSTNPGTETTVTQNPGVVTANSQTSRFFQITDFAVSGATFFEDTRPVDGASAVNQAPQQIKTIVPANTLDGRKEIQKILNDTLSINPPLVVDGSFGKLVVKAIKDFQKLNNIPTTGVVDATTAPYFTKMVQNSPDLKSQVETVPSIRFVQRMNGHIYKMFLDTKSKEKISNSTIPSIYEAFFDNSGKTVIYRYLSDKVISSFMATLGYPKGDFLPQNISDISVSLDKTKYFYITENDTGSIGTLSTFGTTKRDIVFNSPFTEWLSQWDSNSNIYLTTKPSYTTTGSLYILNTNNKTINKIFGGISGLTTLISPNGSFILYSESTSTGPKLGVYDVYKHTIVSLDKYGLPEKCVWSNDNTNVYCAIPSVITGNQYPDSWYQGLVSFSDYFVKINTKTGDTIALANSTDETPIDGTHLFLDKAESLLFFINKKDLTLWGMNL